MEKQSDAMQHDRDAFPVHAKTTKGIIEGNYNTHDGIQTYFGVPFAKPPVGDLRWREPQEMDDWNGVLETKTFGPRPVQALVYGDMNSRSDGVSEDCLYLNIWTPADRNTKDLPVLLYFYGGGNVAGDASEYRYDGRSMAKKGMVVVTSNYRLNVFGFLAHPALSEEAPYQASGNYGLLDQYAAIRWVRDNIASFGGDPDKITIGGESAGSIAVSIHMASPLSSGMIAGAIGQSGSAIVALEPVSLQEAENAGEEFVRNAGFDDFSDFRNLSTRDVYEIYNESGRFGFPMVTDGYVLPGSLPEIFEAGRQAQVPLLVGWNSAEMPAVAFMEQDEFTTENFIERVRESFPVIYQDVLQLYPHSTPEQVEQSATDLASDLFMGYSTWKWFDLHRNNSSQPVYRYLYSKLRPALADSSKQAGLAGGTEERDPDAAAEPEALGAPHAAEIEYALGNLHLVDDFRWTDADFRVSQLMQQYFANFIKTGNPNADRLPYWPPAQPFERFPYILDIDVESQSRRAINDERYLLLEKVLLKR